MKEEQLLLFYEPTEDKMKRELEELRTQLNNTRRGLFKRHGDLAKLYMELRAEVDILKGVKSMEPESKVVELKLYG